MGNMTTDCVKCKCWVICFKLTNFAVRYKSKLDKCLETIADTEHKTVTLIEKSCDCLADSWVSESCCDKLT